MMVETTRFLAAGVFLTLAAVVAPAAWSDVDRAEPGSAEAIALHTTDPRFSSPWVATVPESPDVPSPGDYLGRVVGAAGEPERRGTLDFVLVLTAAAAALVIGLGLAMRASQLPDGSALHADDRVELTTEEILQRLDALEEAPQEEAGRQP